VEKIKIGEKTIFLVGTAHISKQSAELVKKIIEKENPDSVGVELDKERYLQLKHEKKWKETSIFSILKQGKTHHFLLNLLLSNMQKKWGEKIGTKPGEEMLQAIKTAEEKNIPVSMLDRNVKITLKRAFAGMSLGEKAKFFYSLITGIFSEGEEISEEKIEELKQADVMSELMNELGKELPGIKKVLVDERDEYIASKINKMKGKKVVAIIGAGHLKGVKEKLGKKIDVSCLEEISQKKGIMQYAMLLVPVFLAAVLIWTFSTKGIEATASVIGLWILINGLLSALGALLALAHPFSIIAAFLAAPLTSLHPALAAGWFAGMVETKINPPKVKDFETLDKIGSVGDFYKNRVTRIILVTAFANLGSAIGTVIAIPFVLSLL